MTEATETKNLFLPDEPVGVKDILAARDYLTEVLRVIEVKLYANRERAVDDDMRYAAYNEFTRLADVANKRIKALAEAIIACDSTQTDNAAPL